MTRPEFRPDINGLRAVAVLAVLLFHFKVPGVGGGYVGVDVFFVISGYLMTAIILGGLDEGTFSLRRFFWDRFTRIVPALLAMIAVTLASGWLFVDPASYERMASAAASSLLFVSNVDYLLQQDYFAPAAETIWYLHTWSLSVEWQFYLVYPFALLLARRLFGARLVLVVFAAVALGAVAVGLVQLRGSEKVSSILFYMMPFRAPEMLAGALVHLLGPRIAGRRSRGLEVVGLCLIALSFVLFSPATNWPGFAWLLPATGTVMVMLANKGASSLLRTAPLQRIGLWSYGIYLWHWPVVVAIDYAGVEDAASPTAGFLLAIGLGFVSFRLVERPSRARLRAMRGGEQLAVLGGLATAAAACLAIVATGGVPQRLPEAARLAAIDARNAVNEPSPVPPDCLGHFCTINAGHPMDTLVLGDSHAQMFYPRLLRIAEDRGETIALQSYAGCPPVPGLGKRSKPACRSFNEAARREALQDRYRRIVVIAAWNVDFESTPTNQSCLYTGGDCVLMRSDGAVALALAAFESFVAELRHAGKEVVLVVGQPIFPLSVPDEVSRQAFWPSGAMDLTAYPLAKSKPAPPGLESAFRRMATAGVRIIDARAHRCDALSCRLVDERGFSLYRDGNHLRPAVVAEMSGIDAAFTEPDLSPPQSPAALLQTD